MQIFILGENSFIGKSLYLYLKKYRKQYSKLVLLNHNNYQYVKSAGNDDLIINFCGVNRGSSEKEFQEANNIFIKKILEILSATPFIIHISSFMIYGFKDIFNDSLSDYQKWFIESKNDGEQQLRELYNEKKFCILRPSNIYGYNCEPYYNNILTTLVYEKINKLTKINKINENCIRNFLSIEGVCNAISEIIDNKQYGSFNILSNNTVSLDKIVNIIYNNEIPSHINIDNGEISIPNFDNTTKDSNDIIINESLTEKLFNLEIDIKKYISLRKIIISKNLELLSQERGNMVEISSLVSKRLYKITLTNNSIRGNHYHYNQVEEFYVNKDRVIFLLANKDEPQIIDMRILKENDLLVVKPNIIHTLINDFTDNNPEIIITSTTRIH